MIPVKTMPRFKCDFCKKRGISQKIKWHEKNCFRNPNRICSACDNTKFISAGDDYNTQIDCIYCAKFDPNKVKEIEDREKGLTTSDDFFKSLADV